MKAIKNYVWVKPIQPEEKTQSGIILVASEKERPTRGVVTAIGALCEEQMLRGLKIGDTVMFDPDHIRVEENPETLEENFVFFDRNVIAIVE